MEEPAEHWWPPEQGKPDGLLLAVDGEPLQQHRGDGGDAQEMVAKLLKLLSKEMGMETQAEA